MRGLTPVSMTERARAAVIGARGRFRAARLEKLVADRALDNAILEAVRSGKFWAQPVGTAR